MSILNKKKFKDQFTLSERQSQSFNIISKYIDHIPVIVEKNNSTIEDINKQKFLVPKTFTISQFLYVIRKRIFISSEKAIFVFINNKIPNSNLTMSELYSQYKDTDGFLYVVYSTENTFG
jgi:GABA(A) receptor-associated protein